MKNVGLVLEGGGMRGVFTAGVLDYFLDAQIYFPYIIGVSAGASNGLSYASRQRGRAKILNIDYLEKYSYIGLKSFLKCGCIMDYDLLFHDFPQRIFPFDFKGYIENQPRYVITATNCLDGKPRYFEKIDDYARTIQICKASCSMPFVCKKVWIDSEPYLDGGISDALPIRKSISDGFVKNVVVLTRNLGYRKSDLKFKLPFFVYPKYPNLRSTMQSKAKTYNQDLEYIEALEKSGDALVIRPLADMKISRTEKNIGKLNAFYQHGYECAKQAVQTKLKNFLDSAGI